MHKSKIWDTCKRRGYNPLVAKDLISKGEGGNYFIVLKKIFFMIMSHLATLCRLHFFTPEDSLSEKAQVLALQLWTVRVCC